MKGRTNTQPSFKSVCARGSVRFALIGLLLVSLIVFQVLSFFFYHRVSVGGAVRQSGRGVFSSTDDISLQHAVNNVKPALRRNGTVSWKTETGNASTDAKHSVYSTNATKARLLRLTPEVAKLSDVANAFGGVLKRANSTVGQKLSDTISGGKIMGTKVLDRQILTIDALNPRRPKTERSPSYGNLSKFSQLRNVYFDTETKYEGAELYLQTNSIGVTDVTLLSDNKPLPPYVSGSKRAASSVSHPADLILHGRAGFVYNQRDSAKRSRYKLVLPVELHPYRYATLARVPKMCQKEAVKRPRPWLLEFSNVWMTGNGDIFVPQAKSPKSSRNEWDVHAYQYQGGVCIHHWSAIKGKRVAFRGGRKCKTRTKVGFAITQNHGTGYYHVTNEVIPRLLTFWEIAMSVISVKGGVIVAPTGPVVQSMLRSFGVPRGKMKLVGLTQPCFFEKLYMPAPFLQGYYERDCLQRTTGRIIGDNVVGVASNLSSLTLTERRALPSRPPPVVVLIERALGRYRFNTRCRATRCMANFPALRDAVEREFGKRINLQILSARDRNVMRRGIELFNRATVVIGVHGAGFSNLMYMRGAGTYAIHLGWKSTWQIYGKMAQKFNVDFVNIVTRGASQHGWNAFADIPVIILELRQILEREGYPLDAPLIPTNAARNKRVSMRMPGVKRERV